MVNVKINVNPTPYNETLFVGNQFLLTLVLNEIYFVDNSNDKKITYWISINTMSESLILWHDSCQCFRILTLSLPGFSIQNSWNFVVQLTV